MQFKIHIINTVQRAQVPEETDRQTDRQTEPGTKNQADRQRD